ncbi:hypothetical protein [Nocardia sp. CC201C]|uniref:hypothetical protein n=1 Tax=Nocardia sp. CC201C TaxID=3044575 RepID=UPI0024A8A4D8|nr:hypothetical protein [Nocardia sp. CC201C]
MSSPQSKFDELGLKVQRAQYAMEQIRGVGIVDGVRVEVDAENRLLSINMRGAEFVLAAYKAAVEAKSAKVAEAMREVLEDPTVDATLKFAEANGSRLERDRLERQQAATRTADPFDEEAEWYTATRRTITDSLYGD